MARRDLFSWLPGLFGPLNLQADGSPISAKRGTINFQGATITDSPEFDRLDIQLPQGEATTFQLSGTVGQGYALTPSTITPNTYIVGTAANVALAGGVISGISTAAGGSSDAITGLTSGALPDGFFSSGSASGLVVDPSTGQVVRGSVGRNVGWTDAHGNGFFFVPPIKTAGVRKHFNAHDFGLIEGDSSAPVKAANTIALQAMLDAVDFAIDGVGRIGCHIPGGTYYFDNTGIILRRRVYWTGEGFGSTKLVFPAGCIGVYIQTGSAPKNVGGDAGGAEYSVIKDFMMVGGATSPAYTDVPAPNGDHGFQLQAAGVLIDHVYVTNFGGDGFRSDAGIDIPRSGLVSQSDVSKIQNCFSGQNHGWGYNINNGSDNSAILLEHSAAQGNASGDYNENSFLGNTYIGGGAHSESGVGKVASTGGSNYSTFLGLYNEGPELLILETPSVAVGGNMALSFAKNPNNSGLVLGGGGCLNVQSIKYKFTENAWTAAATIALNDHVRPTASPYGLRRWKATSIGSAPHHTGGSEPDWAAHATYGGTTGTITDGDITWTEDGVATVTTQYTAFLDAGALSHGFFHPGLNPQGWYNTANGFFSTPTGWWVHTHSDNFSVFSLALSDANNADAHAHTGAGVAWMRVLKFGDEAFGNGFFIDASTAAPGSGLRWRGDIRFNTTPSVGSPAQWINVSAGSPGTYGAVWCDDLKTSVLAQTSQDWADTAGTDSGSVAAKTAVRSRRKAGATTTATENQVLDTGASYGNQDLTFTSGEARIIDVELIGKRNGAAEATFIKLSGSFYEDSGTLHNVGTDDNTVKESGANISGTTARLHINGLKIEVQVSPANAINIDWTIVRQDSVRLQ